MSALSSIHHLMAIPDYFITFERLPLHSQMPYLVVSDITGVVLVAVLNGLFALICVNQLALIGLETWTFHSWYLSGSFTSTRIDMLFSN